MGNKREFSTKMADSAVERTAGSSDADEFLLSSRKRSKQEKPLNKVPIGDPENKSAVTKVVVATDVSSCQGQENAGSSGKRKHSRWDVSPQTGEQDIGDGVSMTKRRKTRWTDDDSHLKMLGPIHLPDFKVSANAAKDPQLQKLSEQLLDINCKLTYLNSIDKLPMEAPPCQELIKRKQTIIRELVSKHPIFDDPSDLKQQKLFKKLYIPVQEYPEYNFIGLILGPRGRTKDRMEMETGAKIMLRGKGACRRTNGKQDPSDDEDLHVFVEATAQSSLDAAVALVEKLLVPVEDGRNALKRSQLQELAKLNNTLRGEDTLRTSKMSSKVDGTCEICGDLGHYTVACPLTATLPKIKIDENYLLCKTCGDAGHLAVACPFYGTLPQAKINNVTVPPALGDRFSESTKPFPGNQPLDFRPAVSSVPFGSDTSNRGVDCTSLYVAHLPQYVDVGRLVQLFSPFGALSQVKVIGDEVTGLSKGYGFVKYVDPTSAALAMNQMNGYRLDGNTLVVRVAGHQHGTPGSMQPVRIADHQHGTLGSMQPVGVAGHQHGTPGSLQPVQIADHQHGTLVSMQPVGVAGYQHGTPGSMQPVEHTNFFLRPAYPSSSATSHITTPTCWSGPPGSVQPETYNQMHISYSSSYTKLVPSLQTPALNATSEEFARFPGNPDNLASGYRSLFS